MVQLYADAAPLPEAFDVRARRERWNPLDDGVLSRLRESTEMAANVERGWLTPGDLFLTITRENERLTLGEPLAEGEARRDVVACSVFGTRTDIQRVWQGLESVTLLGRTLAAPSSELPISEDVGARHWVVRSGSGEVAYVYAQFRGGTAIIEVGRVIPAG
jgi:hypothetical protein